MPHPTSDYILPRNSGEMPSEITASKESLPVIKLFAVLVCCVQATIPSGYAQVAREATLDDDVIVLSPFVVPATAEDGGYLSSSSLAGTRIKTNLSDVGASITAITNLFLEDTDAKDLNDLLVYTASTESAGENGNYSGGNGGANFIFNPQSAQRVRGLDSANLSRDLFRSTIGWDSYNVSQVEIVRGASSILFGQGSPAGVINANLVKPSFSDKNTIKLRFDDNGSFRTVVDLDKELIDKKLAIRLIALRDDKKFQQDPAFEDDHRLFGTVQWNISKNITLRTNTEHGEIRASRPNLWGPIDGFTDYLKNFGTTTDNNPRQGQAYGDPFGTFAGEGDRPTVGPVQGVIAHEGLFLQWGVAFNGDGSLAGSKANETSFMSILNAASIRANNGVLTPAAYRYWFTKTRRELWSGQGLGAENSSLADYSIFDWKNNNLSGRYSSQNQDFSTYNIALEFLSDKRNFGIELAYDKQSETYKRNADLNSVVRLDVSEYRFDGTPNANLLRPSITVGVGDSSLQVTNTDNETVQATAFAKFDFVKDLGWKGWAGKLLGSHNLTLLTSRNEQDTESQSYAGTWVGEAIDLNVGNGFNPNLPYGHSQRGVVGVVYLGPAATGLDDVTFSSVTTSRSQILAAGQHYDVVVWDKATQTFKTYDYAIADFINGATDTKRTTDTKAAVLQSNWLDNHVVTTIGYRKDDLTDSRKVFGFEPNTAVTDLTNFTEDKIAGGGEYFSWGVVVKSPRNWKLPLNTNFNLFYSESENFDPAASGRLDALGHSIAPPTGTTKDMGIEINTLSDKLSIRINRYETGSTLNTMQQSLVGNTVINFDLRFRELFWLPAVQDGLINPADTTIDTFGLPPAATMAALNAQLQPDGSYTYDSITNTRITDTSDVSATGTEVEIVYSPSRNLRLMANVSRQETARDNSLAGLQAYIAERLPQWEAAFNYPANYNQLNSNNTYLGADGYIDTSKYAPGQSGYGFSLGRSYETLIGQLNAILDEDGGAISEQRKWRVNLVANYAFSSGTILEGFGVGGAYRWQDRSALGFPLITDANGNVRYDVNNPYYGPTESNVDMWISYKRKIGRGKIVWRAQLNVRNLFADDAPVPVSIDSFGAVARNRLPALTTWALTNSFSF